jgi:hypothetical protein
MALRWIIHRRFDGTNKVSGMARNTQHDFIFTDPTNPKIVFQTVFC